MCVLNVLTAQKLVKSNVLSLIETCAEVLEIHKERMPTPAKNCVFDTVQSVD